MTVPRSIRVARALARSVAYALAALLVLVVLTALFLESAWGQERLRRLIVSQAATLLTGRLEIDRVSGSLLRDIRLEGVRLIQDGVPVVVIADATVSYRIRELYQGGTAIRRLRLHGLEVVGARGPDGRWNVAALVRSRPPRQPNQRPGRLVTIENIELVDATVELRDELTFGAARIPTRFEQLNGTLAFELQSPTWRLEFSQLSWRGHSPDLDVRRLAGTVAVASDGWRFEGLRVETPQTSFTLEGKVVRGEGPSRLDLNVVADRFSFREWGGVLPGIRNIAVETAFTTRLQGPPNKLDTALDLHSNAGAIRGAFQLDSTVPGWHGSGTVDVSRLDLSRWLNRPDRPSDITGQVTFDLDLDLGRRFPRGRYAFTGPHAAYLGYEADDVHARGELTREEAVIEAATATAYGANVRVESGAIDIDAPFRYRFAGRADGIDLRRVPRDVPVPHVESTLVLDYTVHGRFMNGTLVGTARFGPSEFLGARIGEGAVGAIDTSVTPFTYSGSGDLTALSVRRFGEGLDVAWMREPRYDGTVEGRFHVEGAGADVETMALTGGGRLARAEMFDGTLTDADVAIEVRASSLRGRYNGRFAGVNPARAFDDPRLAASLTGSGEAAVAVTGLLAREVTLADYEMEGSVVLAPSIIRGVGIEQAEATARLAGQTVTVSRLAVKGLAGEATGQGTIELDEVRSSAFDYEVLRADLARVTAASRQTSLAGFLTTAGRITGPITAPRVAGTARVSDVSSGRVTVVDGALDYDTTVPVDDPYQALGKLSGRVGPVLLAGQTFTEASFAATYDRQLSTLDLRGLRAGGVNASLVAGGQLDVRLRTLDLKRLDLTVQTVAWRLPEGAAVQLAWNDSGVTVQRLSLTDVDTGRQRISVSGDWETDGLGTLHVVAAGVFLDTFTGAMSRPAHYGGRIDADAVIRGTGGGRPVVTGLFTVVDGRVGRLPFGRFMATVAYDDGRLNVDARLDQAPGVWLTAVGVVPLSLLAEGQPDQPIRLALSSSAIELGILEGVTDVVHDLSGRLQADLVVTGTGRDPHLEGSVDVTSAAFAVRATGARYKNVRVAAMLARDRVDLATLHVEDRNGHTLDVTGSLGTHELRVGDLAIEAQARKFEVLRNEFGRTEVDAQLNLRGKSESPRLTGTIGVTSGELNVDEILDRVLIRPYATEAAALTADTELDALAALNPWDRLGLDVAVDTRGTLRMIGSNVQVSSGTPIGLGNVNIRAFGEVYLYKDPAQPLFVTGSLDSLVGTYAFQGRRFDLDQTSSIVFRGDLNPELYVTVTREISGVQARVSIVGPLSAPELRLTSTPQLDDSNILSLIVFNTSINDLSALQQRELAVRAGTLAAGFLATPLVNALERSLGLDILEIETGELAGGTPKVTIGDEIAPGLVARFSRQFGQQEYNEASIEYYLSRLFRIRATFSDAGSTLARSTFRRIERAGVDLLLFFSF